MLLGMVVIRREVVRIVLDFVSDLDSASMSVVTLHLFPLVESRLANKQTIQTIYLWFG